MTDYWKSNPMYWCDVCQVWLQDNQTARNNHDRGRRHQENLSKRLRDMKLKADKVQKDKESVAKSVKAIEAAAKQQYENDKKQMNETVHREAPGKWEFDAGSGYYYNERHRFYYDLKSGWYYGGNPPGWTQHPNIPFCAMFNNAKESKDHTTEASTSQRDSAAPESRAKEGNGIKYKEHTVKVNVPQHPHAAIGGHKMPTVGNLGAQKKIGVGGANKSESKKEDSTSGKKRKAMDSKGLSKEEKEAQAKRDAARARVQQRTMATFGLG